MSTEKKLSELEITQVYRLPFRQFVEWTLLKQKAEFDEGYRHTALWTVAKHVKGLKPDWSAEYAWRRVNSIVKRCLGGWDGWELCGYVSGEYEPEPTTRIDDLQADFIHSWESCRCPGSSDPMERALSNATAWPLKLKNNHRSKGYEQFASLCAHLVLTTGRDVIALGQERVAMMMDYRQATVSEWIRWARQDEWLQLVKKHRFGGKRNRVTRYRVARQLWEEAQRVMEADSDAIQVVGQTV